MSGDPAGAETVIAAARELTRLGVDAFFDPLGREFAAAIGQRHPAGNVYVEATAEAIARCGLPGVDPGETARAVYANFIWTHFVCKLLMTAAPEATVAFIAEHLDTREVEASVEVNGPSILSCFHYSGYPLVALGLAMSSAAPLISKARVDVLDRSAVGAGDHLVHVSKRSAAIRLTRALRQGRSVWVLLDVVLPAVRVARVEFLGQSMDVGAGMGKIARLGDRPCVPVFWELRPGATRVRAAPPIFPSRDEQAVAQAFVDVQAAFIREHPDQWLEWYSALEDAPRLRAEVKKGNEAIWEILHGAFA